MVGHAFDGPMLTGRSDARAAWRDQT